VAIRFGYATIGWHTRFEDTLHTVKRLGFQGVEMFDLLDRVEHSEDVGRMLNEAGLVLAATFFGGSLVQEEVLSRELADFEKTARAVAELGGTCVVVGGGRIRDKTREEDFVRLTKNLNELGHRARRAGVQMALHPHHGTLVFARDEIDSAMAVTDPELVKLAPDTGHLHKAGINPSVFLRCYRNRVVHVHLKDLRDDDFVELGTGTVPIGDFYQALKESDYDGWCIVELDASAEPADSARISARYLQTLNG